MDSTSRALPTGGCNFRNLAQGVTLTCGCQRFWLRKRKRGNRLVATGEGEGEGGGGGGGGPISGKEISRVGRISERNDFSQRSSFIDNDSEDSDDEDCRCGHHACYHSFESPISTHTQSTGRRYSLQISDAEASLRLDRSTTNLAASGFSIISGTTTERDYPTATEQSPSVVAAQHLKRHNTHQSSHLGTDLSAPKNSSQATGKGEEYGDTIGPQSTLETLISRVEGFLLQLQQASPAVFVEFSTKLTKLIGMIERLEKSSLSHNERLETVETFGSILEEVRDKIELAEDRANEVEEKVFSFENRLDDRLAPIESLLKSHRGKRKTRGQGVEDGGSPQTRKRCKGGRENELGTLPEGSSQLEVRTMMTASFTTNTSTPTSSSSTPTSRDKESHGVTASRLELLESRLIRIEKNAPPSPETPWVIEVVLLPPAPLRGIWTDGLGSVGGYESSNPQSVSTFSGACSVRRQSHDYDDGPLPRSFGVNSRLYRRLRTRGFVKNIHVLGPTGQDVATAVDLNFGTLLGWCHSLCVCDDSVSPQPPSTPHPRVSLNWQPLRKVHKQTSLEYLKPGEMMEIMWTVEFLKGSCIMKGRRGVLYITPLLSVHPASISQHSGISWMDIKGLPEYKAIVEIGEDIKLSPSSQPDPESVEECWAWKEALDGVPKVPTASPSARSESPRSWSSFGPFQREDEVRLSTIVQRDSNEELQQEATPTEAVAGPGLNDHHSPGPPSPPTSIRNRKRKPSSPLADGGSRIREVRAQRRLRRQQRESPGFSLEGVAVGIEGLTPALTATRSSSFPPGSMAASGRASIARQGSGFSGLSVFSGFSAAGDWELSQRTLKLFTENPMGGEGLIEEEKSESLGKEESPSEVTGEDTVEDTVEDTAEYCTEEALEDGDGGYASMLADWR